MDSCHSSEPIQAGRRTGPLLCTSQEASPFHNNLVVYTFQGTDCQLAIETSGHAAFKENMMLDDGAYLALKVWPEILLETITKAHVDSWCSFEASFCCRI